MKSFKAIGVCLVAVFATSAVTVASASAEAPEYGRCVKVAKPYNGGFTNSGCTTKSETKTGKYEWYPGVVKKLQTSSRRERRLGRGER